jgi:glycosyltransferase involved in cell wall biosynthesis/peptidoglycan/xylan/chitin deacetylase (PgdA/CDA1 family)
MSQIVENQSSPAKPKHRSRWVAASPPWRDWTAAIAIPMAAGVGAVLNRMFGAISSNSPGILMYHRVCPKVPGIPSPSINVTPKAFRNQLQGLLKRGYEFWPLEKLLEVRRSGATVPSKIVCVTFDDGFRNVALNALPVLEELNIPATIFLATGYLDSEQPFPFDHWASEHHERLALTAYAPLSTEECQELAEHPLITLGAHTHTHEDFRHRPEAFHADLSQCLDYLKENLGIENPLFAFPYGTPRHGFADAALCQAAAQSGVRCALNTGPEVVDIKSTPFSWGRFNAFSWDNGESLASMLSGWYSWANSVRNRVGRTTLGIRKMFVSGKEESFPVLDGSGDYTVDSASLPTITIVVPTYNRAHWIGEALQTLDGQATEGLFHYDVVVIDNASSDNTKEVVEKVAANVSIDIHYIYQTTPGDAPTRNAGLRSSTSDWYAFFDDDQLAEPNWLLGLFKATRDCGANVVGGPVLLDLPEEELEALGPICRRALRELNYYSRLHPYIDKNLPGTGNALVARQVFDSVGLFDESMTSGGSDSDFFMRARLAGHSLWFTPDAAIRHRIGRDRLEPEFFRWDALSGGAGHAAYFDYREEGARGLVWTCLLRLVHAAVCVVPALFWAWTVRDRGAALGRKTQLWRMEGYFRRTLSVLAPKLFAQEKFFASLEFRKGRTVVSGDEQDVDVRPARRHKSESTSSI